MGYSTFKPLKFKLMHITGEKAAYFMCNKNAVRPRPYAKSGAPC